MLEHHYYKQYGLQMFSKINENRLTFASERPVIMKTVKGTHSYDILKNKYYRHMFQYVQVQTTSYGNRREKYIITEDDDEYHNCEQSDLVRLALFFPFLSAQKQFYFGFDLSNYFTEEVKETYKSFVEQS